MKVKIDVRDERLINWLTHELGPAKFKYHIRTEEIEFYDPEDFLVFRLRFQEATSTGFIYAPYIPEFDYYYKDDKKS